MRRYAVLLAVVISLLFLLAIFAKQAKSQPNNASTTQNSYLEYLTYMRERPYKRLEDQEHLNVILRAEKLRGKWGGQCVVFARNFLGRAEIKGVARDIPTNNSEPAVGGLIKFETGTLDHVGVILQVWGNAIYYVDSNGNRDEIIQTRWVDEKDKTIIGYTIIKN